MYVLALGLVLGGGLVALLAALTWRKVARLERSGVTVTGAVIGADRTVTPTGFAEEEVKVRFVTLDGREVVTYFDVLPEDGILAIGDTVPLVYDPEHPDRTRLVHGRNKSPATVLSAPIAIGTAGIVAGIVVAIVQLLG